MTSAQLQIAIQMIDQQKQQIIQLGAQAILFQQENAKLKAEIEALKSKSDPAADGKPQPDPEPLKK